MKVRTVRIESQINRDTNILTSRCDLCNDQITEAPQDFQYRIEVLTAIDDSFESDYDKSTYHCGPKLILCDYCAKEYLLSAYK